MFKSAPIKLNKTLFYLIIIFFSAVLAFDLTFKGEQQFSYLAGSFLQGRTFFVTQPGSWNDAIYFNGHYYWPLGPFPAILLMPFYYIFSLFGRFFYQGYLQIFVVLGVFYLVFKIARKVKYTYEDSLFLAFAFCFSSVFLGIALLPWSWYFAQTITVLFLFWLIYEYLNRRRYWFIGLVLGLVLLTRISASLILTFFLLDILILSKKNFSNKIGNLLKLTIPYGVVLTLLGLYNYMRYGNFFETGYCLANLPIHGARACDYGLISLAHLPGNIYYFLLATPLPVFRDGVSHVLKFPFVKASHWGMSIFITSPYFIYLFFLKHKDRLSKALLLSSFAVSFSIFLFYGLGWRQFGYRYSLDFLPLLFLLLIRNYRRKHKFLSNNFKLLILISAVTNLYLFMTLFV